MSCIRASLKSSVLGPMVLLVTSGLLAGGSGEGEDWQHLIVSRDWHERKAGASVVLQDRRATIAALLRMVELPVEEAEEFSDPDSPRNLAIGLLGELRAPEAVRALVQRLTPMPGQNVGMRSGLSILTPAGEALVKIGPPAVPAVLEILASVGVSSEDTRTKVLGADGTAVSFVGPKPERWSPLGDSCLRILVNIKGLEETEAGLRRYIAVETDGARKKNLEGALAALSRPGLRGPIQMKQAERETFGRTHWGGLGRTMQAEEEARQEARRNEEAARKAAREAAKKKADDQAQPAPELPPPPAANNPVSHTKNVNVTVDVNVTIAPPGVQFSLVGASDVYGLCFVQQGTSTSTAQPQTIRLTSLGPIDPNVAVLEEPVDWYAVIGSNSVGLGASGPHKVFVTWGAPGVGPTFKRVEWVCTRASGAATLEAVADALWDAVAAETVFGGGGTDGWALLDGGTGDCDNQAYCMELAVEMPGAGPAEVQCVRASVPPPGAGTCLNQEDRPGPPHQWLVLDFDTGAGYNWNAWEGCCETADHYYAITPKKKADNDYQMLLVISCQQYWVETDDDIEPGEPEWHVKEPPVQEEPKP